MSEKRKTYDKEFKLSAVKMIVDGGMRVSRVSKDLGVNENSLHNWKRTCLEDQQKAVPGKGRMKPEEEEQRKLKRELHIVTLERDIKKNHRILHKGPGVKYMFIKEHRKQYPLGVMSEVLGVSRSGYHKWIRRKVSSKAIENQRLLAMIVFHYKRRGGRYGLLRILAANRREGIVVNKKRIARLMRENNIKAKTKRRFKITTSRTQAQRQVKT